MLVATGITRPYDEGFFFGPSASAVATEIGTRWDIALGGRPYILDLDFLGQDQGYVVKSLPLLQRYYLTQTQGNLGEQCVDDETEILTQRGWLTCDELQVGDWAWTIRIEDGLAEWQPIEKINLWPARSRSLVSLEARNHSSVSTLDHRWPINYRRDRCSETRGRRFETTENLNTNASLLTAAPVAHDIDPKFSDAFVELVGWFWAEGSVTVRSNGSIRRCEVAQSRKVNQPKVDRIRSLFVRLLPDGGWNEYENPNGCTQFQFHPDVLPELLDVMEKVRPYKAVRPEFIAQLTQAQLRLFIEGCFLGDGYWNGRSHLMAQKYRDGLATIQMACVLAGYRTSLTEKRFGGQPNQWKLQWHDKWTQVNVAEMRRTEIEHGGRVWCPTIANSTWMARRRGTCYFTGNSLNPEDYWRRSVDSWANGAGQLYNDRDQTDTTQGSTRSQFRKSKGIDPWTAGQLTLLHDTTLISDSTNDVLETAICGTELHYLDGDIWSSAPDGVTFTPLTGSPLADAASMSSDGFTVWVVDSVDTYYTTRGLGSYSTWFATPLPGTLVRDVKGRLFVCDGNVINTSDVNPGAAVSTAFYTHPNPDWTWVDVSEGPVAIYFAGFSGDKSIIYQTQIAADGTDLVIPSAAATLPSGEIVRSIRGYLGVLMIGTDKGVRVAAMDSQGNLTVGDLIKTNASVECFEPQENFVWFGWPDYEQSSGLGRVDLGTFNNSVPAYATDLMAPDTGAVTSVGTYNSKRIFTISGSGLWSETSTFCPTGSLFSGGLNFALPDVKIAVKFDMSYQAGAGTITVLLSADDQPFVTIGTPVETTDVQGSNVVLPAGLVSGRKHEIELELARGDDPTEAPVIDRWTLLTNPAPERRVQIIAALYLYTEMHLRNGATTRINPLLERQQIDTWMQSNEVITFQDSETTYAVTVDDYEWRAANQIDPKERAWQGTMIVTLKEIR